MKTRQILIAMMMGIGIVTMSVAQADKTKVPVSITTPDKG